MFYVTMEENLGEKERQPKIPETTENNSNKKMYAKISDIENNFLKLNNHFIFYILTFKFEK